MLYLLAIGRRTPLPLQFNLKSVVGHGTCTVITERTHADSDEDCVTCSCAVCSLSQAMHLTSSYLNCVLRTAPPISAEPGLL